MSRPRALAVAVGALVLLLALSPFVPRGGSDDDGALRPSGDRATTDQLLPANAVGSSRVTPAMQTEIDRVVAAGRTVARPGTKAGLARSAAELVRCAELDGQRYCLGVGWTDDTEADVQARFAAAARVALRTTRVDTTGDLDAAATLARKARMTSRARAAADRAELEDAARAVTKVWLLRHEIQGVALPADFLARHPEARARAAAKATPSAKATPKPTPTPTPSASPTIAPIAASATPTTTPVPIPGTTPTTVVPAKTARSYPERATVLNEKQVQEQIRNYWCGPTTMQMIGWGWAGKARRQAYWAKQLGTTRSGTAITDMVRVVNRSTGWDDKDHAGTYVTLDIGSWTFAQWQLLMMRHIADYQAPVVLHPVLRKRYYPYLDDDGSGHFQVGRGYDKNGKKPALLGYFEPWNQQRFDPSEPYIARVQWRDAYRSYRANKAHFQHNIGV